MTHFLCFQIYSTAKKNRIYFPWESNLGVVGKNYISSTVRCCSPADNAICFPPLKRLFSLWHGKYAEIYSTCTGVHISLPLGGNLVSMEDWHLIESHRVSGSFPTVPAHSSAWSKCRQMRTTRLPGESETSCWLMSLKQPVKTVATN